MGILIRSNLFNRPFEQNLKKMMNKSVFSKSSECYCICVYLKCISSTLIVLQCTCKAGFVSEKAYNTLTITFVMANGRVGIHI